MLTLHRHLQGGFAAHWNGGDTDSNGYTSMPVPDYPSWLNQGVWNATDLLMLVMGFRRSKFWRDLTRIPTASSKN